MRRRNGSFRTSTPFTFTLAVTLAACAGGDAGDGLEQAEARSRAVAEAEWWYGKDTLPPERGERTPRIVDRCRVAMPAGANAADTLEVACGVVFLALEPDADSAWIDRLLTTLDVEVADRGRVPGWATSLDAPVEYLLVRTDPGREQRTLQRALASEGIRFVDVRAVSRRRP